MNLNTEARLVESATEGLPIGHRQVLAQLLFMQLVFYSGALSGFDPI